MEYFHSKNPYRSHTRSHHAHLPLDQVLFPMSSGEKTVPHFQTQANTRNVSFLILMQILLYPSGFPLLSHLMCSPQHWEALGDQRKGTDMQKIRVVNISLPGEKPETMSSVPFFMLPIKGPNPGMAPRAVI